MAKKTCQRGRVSSGVAIILIPDLQRACNMAGKPPPITSEINSNFHGRMIGVTLCFPNQSNKKLENYHKRGKGTIKIFLSSIYHPVEHDEQKRFNEELKIFYHATPSKSEVLSG